MDYLQATKRFDFEIYLSKLANLDLIEIIKKTEEAIKISEQINISTKEQYYKDIVDLKYRYVINLKALLCLLRDGNKYQGVKDEDFINFKPICEGLIKKEQLNETILDLFD